MLLLGMLLSLLAATGRRISGTLRASRVSSAPKIRYRSFTRLNEGTHQGEGSSSRGGEETAVPVESGDKKTKKPKKMKFDARRDDLIECVRSRDHSLALRIYAEATSTDSLTASTLYSLLSTCTKAEHLDSAVLFFNDLIKFGASPLEQAYLALIRCYTDANRFQEVVSIVKSMHELNIEVRHRTFQPILEAHLRNNDIESILTLLFKMISLGVHPRSEQIAVLLYCCSKTDATAYKSAIDAVILESSKDLIGLEFVAMKDLKRVSEGGLTIEQVEEQGILVDSFECVPGKVLEKTDSFVIAQNASFDVFSSVESLEDMRVGNRAATTTSLPSNATVLEPAAAPVVSREGEVDVDFNRGQMELFVEDRYVVRPEAFEPLRVNVVDIASSSCRCPNCGARIQSIPLSEETKHSARVGLMRVASAASVGHCRSLQAFGSWLEDRPQYRYIIDGANVAYNKQNFGSGRFSYRQIEFVVDSLRKQTNDRVLVLIPQNYVNRVVPNSAKNRVGVRFSQTTADDQRVLERLKAEDMLYVVPSGANDDWYWLYATVAPNRTSFAVTNDLTRDHRLAFLESRMYVRWRSNHIVHFELERAIENSTDSTSLKLTFPELFTREIQFENDRWHFPASDRHAWLCFDAMGRRAEAKASNSSGSISPSPS